MPSQVLLSLYKVLNQFAMPYFALHGLVSGGLINMMLIGNQATKPVLNKLRKDEFL